MRRLVILAAACGALGACERCGEGPRPDATAPAPPTSDAADAAPARATSSAPVAEVARSAGDVRWQAAETAAWEPAETGLGLRPDDTIQTMASGLAELRFLATGGLARLGPSTTLRVPGQERRVSRLRHLRGPLVARLSAGSETSHMEVELPAGTLLLDTPEDAGAGPEEAAVEARVDVSDDRTEVSMIKGAGTLSRASAEPLRIEEEHFVEVAGDGTLLDSGRLGPVVTLLAPDDGATVRTRRQVDLSWSAADGADGYVLDVVAEDGTSHETRVAAARTSTPAELPSGRYLWNVHAVVGDSVAQAGLPRAVVVDVDQTPPALEVETPAAGAVVRGPTVLVSGHTEPGASVTVDGRPAQVQPDGSFSVAHPVERGLVNVVVRATDDLGNARAVSRAVLRE